MNTLTRERIEQIREYALAGKVDTILVREQECVALCDHALSDLRRESAAPDGGLSPLEIKRWRKVMLSHWVADEGGKWLTREESTRQANAMADMALRSLERPAGRVVPEEPTYEMMKALAGEPLILAASEFLELQARYKAMLAASPPAATEGWVSVPNDVFLWLMGESPLNGEWFERPAGAGAYWWRSVLRQSVSITQQSVPNARPAAPPAEHPSGGAK